MVKNEGFPLVPRIQNHECVGDDHNFLGNQSLLMAKLEVC